MTIRRTTRVFGIRTRGEAVAPTDGNGDPTRIPLRTAIDLVVGLVPTSPQTLELMVGLRRRITTEAVVVDNDTVEVRTPRHPDPEERVKRYHKREINKARIDDGGEGILIPSFGIGWSRK